MIGDVIGRGSQSIHLSVAIRRLITAQACSSGASLPTKICSAKHSHACGNIRLDITPDKIDSPGRTDQRPDRRMLEDHRFDRRVRLDRGKYGFSQISVDLRRVDSGAQESVVERIAYTREVMGRVMAPRGSLGVMGLVSVSVIKAAKRPMLWTWNYQ